MESFPSIVLALSGLSVSHPGSLSSGIMILLCFPLLGTPFIQLLGLNGLGQLVSCSLLFFNFLNFLCLLALPRGVSKLYLPTLLLKNNLLFKISIRYLIFKCSFVPWVFFCSLVSWMSYLLIPRGNEVFSSCIVFSSNFFFCWSLRVTGFSQMCVDCWWFAYIWYSRLKVLWVCAWSSQLHVQPLEPGCNLKFFF